MKPTPAKPRTIMAFGNEMAQLTRRRRASGSASAGAIARLRSGNMPEDRAPFSLEPRWWRNAPPGTPRTMADEFIARLKSGSTVRKITRGIKGCGPLLVTASRFKKHCELHPEWAVEAWWISIANTNAGRSARFRAMTHCKYGHPLLTVVPIGLPSVP